MENAASPPAATGLTLGEAAARLGVSERTLRQRIKEGKVAATKVIDRGNAAYRVFLDASSPAAEVQPPPAVDALPPVATTRLPPVEPPGNPELHQALALVDRLSRENVELAGRVGFYQAKLQEAEAKIALLGAPKQAFQQARRPWWQFWRSG